MTATDTIITVEVENCGIFYGKESTHKDLTGKGTGNYKKFNYYYHYPLFDTTDFTIHYKVLEQGKWQKPHLKVHRCILMKSSKYFYQLLKNDTKCNSIDLPELFDTDCKLHLVDSFSLPWFMTMFYPPEILTDLFAVPMTSFLYFAHYFNTTAISNILQRHIVEHMDFVSDLQTGNIIEFYDFVCIFHYGSIRDHLLKLLARGNGIGFKHEQIDPEFTTRLNRLNRTDLIRLLLHIINAK